MSNNKKMKPSNVIIDCIIAGVILVIVIVLGGSFLGKKSDDKEDATEPKPVKAAEESVSKDKNTEQYACVIASGGNNDTVFSISFHSDRMTYEEAMSAGSQSSILDKGTYEVKDGKYITTSTKSKKENTYVRDGEYLIVENEMYEGELPAGDKVDAQFVYEVEGECKNTLTLKEDGTYSETIVSYAVDGSSGGNTEKTTTGTYTRDGKFVKRVADEGGVLLDFYIYNNKISNAYYKIIK